MELYDCPPSSSLHLGLVAVTCFISLWISNSAATAMMCPIVKAVLMEMEAVSDISLIFKLFHRSIKI